MRQLITSLQSHNRQLKAELNRQKRKAREQLQEIEGLKQEQEIQKQKEEPAYRIFTDLENEVLMTGSFICKLPLKSYFKEFHSELLKSQ